MFLDWHFASLTRMSETRFHLKIMLVWAGIFMKWTWKPGIVREFHFTKWLGTLFLVWKRNSPRKKKQNISLSNIPGKLPRKLPRSLGQLNSIPIPLQFTNQNVRLWTIIIYVITLQNSAKTLCAPWPCSEFSFVRVVYCFRCWLSLRFKSTQWIKKVWSVKSASKVILDIRRWKGLDE